MSIGELSYAALGITPQPWHDQAACASTDPELFYPPDHRGAVTGYRAAKRVCAGCPVKAECLADAMERDEQWGVWGGLAPDERLALRRVS